MFFPLPKIYPITDVQLTGLSHAKQVERLIAGGARLVQLREKRHAPRVFFADAARALEIARAGGARLVINDRVDLALAVGADGVHLGQTDLPPAEARKILGERAIIGFSTHSVEQALAARRMPIDYLAVGPVFATTTKENPDEIVGVEGVRRVRAAIGRFPLVAIGGLDADNCRAVLAAGADSLAVVKAVLTPPAQIEENLRRLIGRT